MSIPDSTLRQYIDTIFVKYDRDRSMTLDISELANFFNDVFMMMGDPRRINQQQAYQALMMIDQNNDGRASKN
jgi:Ca2+-binding EF-hand superfamily protein